MERHFIRLVGTGLALLLPTLALADAEVTRNSNGSWQSRVEGSTVYNGSRFFDAVNAAANSMGPGTINIRNSGNSGPDGGNVYGIRPQPNQTLDFHDNTVHADGGELIVPVYCDRRDNITVRNLKVTGSPRYGVWFRGCSDITLEDIEMDLSYHPAVGLGIRVDYYTGPSSNLTIRGNININGSTTHAIETYGVEGFSIGDVTVTNSGGSGLLLNDSRNGTVGHVRGHHNNLGGGYATFRVANDNGPNVTVESVYSRDSGRGFFSVTNSHGTTIKQVDIANSTKQNILLQNAWDTHVLAGKVSNGNPNCQLVSTDTSNSSLRVSGCSYVGTPPSDTGDGSDNGSGGGSGGSNSNGTVNGTYQIRPLHSGKALDVNYCSASNGTNIQQWAWLNNDCQKWKIEPVDGIWHRISPLVASNKALDVSRFSTSNGANLMLWDYWGSSNQQFRFQSAGSGKWRIINRNSELCADVENRSAANGANLAQWECIAGNDNQVFELIRP
ncbi:RICIN domain-containing protein [Ketobacter sp.]